MQPSALNSQRSSNLSKRLYKALCETSIRVPQTDESEPSFTRTVLAPVIRSEVSQLVGIGFQFRGDGGDSQAVPASALDVDFYPDLAISLGRQHLWAAEVKILRENNRQNSIATALGQATLYRSRYEHVLVVLVDLSPVSSVRQQELIEDARHMGIRVAIRTRAGKSLLKQIGH